MLISAGALLPPPQASPSTAVEGSLWIAGFEAVVGLGVAAGLGAAGVAGLAAGFGAEYDGFAASLGAGFSGDLEGV